MTTKKTSRGKRKTRTLKLKKETLRDLDANPKAAKVKGGDDTDKITNYLCQTGNMFCNPMTLQRDCATLNNCPYTFAFCNAGRLR